MTLDEWRFSANLAWQNRFIKWTTLGCAFVWILMTAFLLWKSVQAGWHTNLVTLHYTIYLGVDDIRPLAWVLTVPGGMLGVLLVNTLCALGLYRKDELAAKTLTALSVVMTVMWTVVSFFLVLVNL